VHRAPPGADPSDILAVHDALQKLEDFDARAATIVKLRCFVGKSIAEVAKSLGLCSRTVNRDWLVASAWLRRALSEDRPGDGKSPRHSDTTVEPE
jgi:hypothetical protein